MKFLVRLTENIYKQTQKKWFDYIIWNEMTAEMNEN